MENEDQNTQSNESEQEASAEESSRAAGQELVDELTRLGQKFAEVIEAAWNSEQRHKIEEDLRTGLNSVAASLEGGVKKAADSQEAKEFLDAAEDVTERVRTHKVSIELADALSQALRKVSDKFDEIARDLEQKKKADAPETEDPEDAQDIPITKV